MEKPPRITSLDPILNLAKRRGLFFNSADIYNGANGLFDYGPLGVEMITTIKRLWWRRFVLQRDDMLGLNSAILTPAAILKASGHVDSFADPLIECQNCHIRLRSDHYLEEENPAVFVIRWRDEAMKFRKLGEKRATEEAEAAAIKLREEKILTCPNCTQAQFGEPRMFNMMFATQLGAVEGAGSTVYLRPETAQGIFTNFKNVLDTYHRKLPFGIAQIGKAFRNEITTGNSLFRVREFEQMEIEYFVKPGKDEPEFDAWLVVQEEFLTQDLGIERANLRPYEHAPEKLSHYSKKTVDWEYDFPFGGWGELTGLANRTDFDLKQHQEHSGKDLTFFDEEARERYIPYVIEPTFGLDRALLTVLIDAYREYPQGRDGQGSEMETVLHLAPHLAPIAVAVLPLMKKDGLPEKAKEIRQQVRALFPDRIVAYEDTGAIGKRYRKQDEIGTPWCITIDYQTLEDGTFTLRNRDSMSQERITTHNLAEKVS